MSADRSIEDVERWVKGFALRLVIASAAVGAVAGVITLLVIATVLSAA